MVDLERVDPDDVLVGHVQDAATGTWWPAWMVRGADKLIVTDAAVNIAPSLADNAGTSSIVGQCANILSRPTGYRAGMVADCHSGKKRQKPSAMKRR